MRMTWGGHCTLWYSTINHDVLLQPFCPLQLLLCFINNFAIEIFLSCISFSAFIPFVPNPVTFQEAIFIRSTIPHLLVFNMLWSLSTLSVWLYCVNDSNNWVTWYGLSTYRQVCQALGLPTWSLLTCLFSARDSLLDGCLHHSLWVTSAHLLCCQC